MTPSPGAASEAECGGAEGDGRSHRSSLARTHSIRPRRVASTGCLTPVARQHALGPLVPPPSPNPLTECPPRPHLLPPRWLHFCQKAHIRATDSVTQVSQESKSCLAAVDTSVLTASWQ